LNFNYDVEHSYLGCSFFQEDADHIIDLLLDLALGEKNLFEVKQTLYRKFIKQQGLGKVFCKKSNMVLLEAKELVCLNTASVKN